MRKQFVPYEIALKLKQLGFKEECLGYWDSERELLINTTSFDFYQILSYGVLVPLWQQAFDYLRKNYNLYGIIIPTETMSWTFKIINVVDGVVELPPYRDVEAFDYSTYEEATKAYLQKSLTLIK